MSIEEKLFSDPFAYIFTEFFPKVTSTGLQSHWDKFKTVNTDEYDLVPKPSYIEKQIAAKEEEKKNIERTKEMAVLRYEAQISGLEDEIKKLKKQLK